MFRFFTSSCRSPQCAGSVFSWLLRRDGSSSPDKPASAPSSPKPSKPLGTILLAKLEHGAVLDGVYGILLDSRAEIDNLSGAKIELAAHFFDDKGNPLKDRDRVNRSSRGQVYVGKESVVPSNAFSLKDDLFIPYQQLDVTSEEAQDIQIELVLWEYSQGRGQRLAIAPRVTFTHTPLSTSERVNREQRENLSGGWRHDDAVITIVQQDDIVVIEGLGIVPYNIVSEKWVYAEGMLHGSVINKRKLPPLTRMWEFELQISQDGNRLSGTFHRSDRKGNFAFDSAPFVWTRIR